VVADRIDASLGHCLLFVMRLNRVATYSIFLEMGLAFLTM